MSETFEIKKESAQEEQYELFLKQVKALLDKRDNIISSLSNVSAALKLSFDKISWVGFYLFDGKKLYLGPFQGKIACTNIEIGKGVCGTAAELKQTVVVPDVNNFPGHIACDPESKSEIVIPLMKNDELYGVLDVDSYYLNSFDNTDKKYLEELCLFLGNEIL